MRFSTGVLLIAASALVANGSTVAPVKKDDSRWVKVSQNIVFYDPNTPEHIKKALRGNTIEFNIFGNPPTFPDKMTAEDFRGMKEEHDIFDLS